MFCLQYRVEMRPCLSCISCFCLNEGGIPLQSGLHNDLRADLHATAAPLALTGDENLVHPTILGRFEKELLFVY